MSEPFAAIYGDTKVPVILHIELPPSPWHSGHYEDIDNLPRYFPLEKLSLTARLASGELPLILLGLEKYREEREAEEATETLVKWAGAQASSNASHSMVIELFVTDATGEEARDLEIHPNAFGTPPWLIDDVRRVARERGFTLRRGSGAARLHPQLAELHLAGRSHGFRLGIRRELFTDDDIRYKSVSARRVVSLITALITKYSKPLSPQRTVKNTNELIAAFGVRDLGELSCEVNRAFGVTGGVGLELLSQSKNTREELSVGNQGDDPPLLFPTCVGDFLELADEEFGRFTNLPKGTAPSRDINDFVGLLKRFGVWNRGELSRELNRAIGVKDGPGIEIYVQAENGEASVWIGFGSEGAGVSFPTCVADVVALAREEYDAYVNESTFLTQ